jgi:hypothetical protein
MLYWMMHMQEIISIFPLERSEIYQKIVPREEGHSAMTSLTWNLL